MVGTSLTKGGHPNPAEPERKRVLGLQAPGRAFSSPLDAASYHGTLEKAASLFLDQNWDGILLSCGSGKKHKRCCGR